MSSGLDQLIGAVEALVDRIESEPRRCREFRLYRHTDAAGHVPAEVLAVGVVLPSGRTVMEFCAAPDLIDLRDDTTELLAVYGDGRTEIIFLD